MLFKRFITLSIAISIVVISSCTKEPVQPPVVEETISSPQNLADWIEQLNAVIRATNTNGPEASRIYAYGSIAFYEGYASRLDDLNSLAGRLNGLAALPDADENEGYNYGIIADAAIFTVVSDLINTSEPSIANVLSSTYTNHERQYVNNGVTNSIVERSREFGQLLGQRILEWAEEDGFESAVNCSESVPVSATNWQPTPPSFLDAQHACWGNLRPFISNTNSCEANEPLTVDFSSESNYFADMQEVEEVGNNLNSGQIELARFWNDGQGSFTVTGHYMSILKQLIENDLIGGKETVTAFAHLGISIADTYTNTFREKYTTYRPRPITTIQENLDMNWNSELDNPYTPEYPSLRVAAAYSAADVLTNYYGNIELRDNTYSSVFNIDERVYSSFNEMAQEASLSRLYAGTNYRTTVEYSGALGTCTSQRVATIFTE